MDIIIDSLSRKGQGKISLRKLRREAIKTEINPALNNLGAKVNLTKNGRRGITLGIDYKGPIEALRAYGHARSYEVLAEEIGSNMEWYNPQIKINSSSELNFGEGSWTLKTVDENNYPDKIRMLIGVEGYPKREAGKDFDKVLQSTRYSDIGLSYRGEPVLSSSYIFLESFVDNLNPEVFSKKIKAAEDWLEPYWMLIHRSWREGLEGSVNLAQGVFLEKQTPRRVDRITVEVPLGDFNGSRIIAEYDEDFRD